MLVDEKLGDYFRKGGACISFHPSFLQLCKKPLNTNAL